jgi:hypothetical protein
LYPSNITIIQDANNNIRVTLKHAINTSSALRNFGFILNKWNDWHILVPPNAIYSYRFENKNQVEPLSVMEEWMIYTIVGSVVCVIIITVLLLGLYKSYYNKGHISHSKINAPALQKGQEVFKKQYQLLT